MYLQELLQRNEHHGSDLERAEARRLWEGQMVDLLQDCSRGIG